MVQEVPSEMIRYARMKQTYRRRRPYEWTDAETEAYFRAALEESRYMNPAAYTLEDIAGSIES